MKKIIAVVIALVLTLSLFTAPKTEQAEKFLQSFEFKRKNKAEA